VAQLLSEAPPAHYGADRALLLEGKAPVYVCGDSHALSPAWRSVNGRLLVPKLVTGLKHWHLREDSSFYPKKNFHQVVKTIPENSEVVWIFGEIDCREGLLLAVEKDRYKNLDEAMEKCIAIWMRESTKVIKGRKLKAWVHPVVPVLNETRTIVCKYNLLLKKAVDRSPDMEWLDCFEEMLQVDKRGEGYELKESLKLDGTHLHPSYLSLLEKFIK
jgi:hypothetical protein